MPPRIGLPKQKLLRFLLRYRRFVFVAIVFVVLFRSTLYTSPDQTTRTESSNHGFQQNPPPKTRFWHGSFLGSYKYQKPQPKQLRHPIPKLMDDAELQFESKLASQSKSLADAVEEYGRRYKRDPPKGFDQWFQFAKENDFQMMDEFDGLMRDLEPFWGLSGTELRMRCRLAASLPSIDLVLVEDGRAEVLVPEDGDAEGNARAYHFVEMMERFVDKMPDMVFPINAKAEPRVIPPWEQVGNLSSMTRFNAETILGGDFTPTWKDNDGTVWESWRRACPPGTTARRPYSSMRNSLASGAKPYLSDQDKGEQRDFKFVKDTPAQIDFCSHPHAHLTQGHFFSDWRAIPVLLPVFTPAKTKGFMDIRIPSHYYWSNTPEYSYGWDPVAKKRHEVDSMEVPWEEKIDKIFWRGATTGGGSSPPGFMPHYHRHRFIRMTSDATDTNRSVTYTNPPSSGNLATTKVSISKLNEEIMDTAFTKALDPEAYPGGLEALQAAHRFGDTVPLGRHWSYRYLADLDGMSYSGRFFSFLESDSVPIKATIYEEFFSDWIQPWVHFIPLSTSYKEIYNIFSYFSGPTNATLEAANSTLVDMPMDQRRPAEGERRLRKIALEGRRWKKSMGRMVDIEVYMYRLCLEWARLSADDRDAMTFAL